MYKYRQLIDRLRDRQIVNYWFPESGNIKHQLLSDKANRIYMKLVFITLVERHRLINVTIN